MKTTVEIPDDLFRKAKAKAAMEGLPLRDLVVHGLHVAITELDSVATHSRRTEFPIIKARRNAELLTSEQVTEALEMMDNEDAVHDASFV